MSSVSAPRAAVFLLLLSAINAMALAWWLILGFDSGGSISSLSGVRFAAPVALSVLVPIVSVIGWRAIRRRQAGLTQRARAYVLGSIVFLALSWAPAIAVAAGLVWMEEPWPLSMQQGPDTSRARAVFRRNFGVEPSVSQVYARVDWAGTMYIAFSFEDAAVVQRIVVRRSLLPVSSSENAEVGVAGPSWFPSAAALAQLPEKYVDDLSRGRKSTLMWVDRVRRRVFVLYLG
jgi:hypothetical protein